MTRPAGRSTRIVCSSVSGSALPTRANCCPASTTLGSPMPTAHRLCRRGQAGRTDTTSAITAASILNWGRRRSTRSGARPCGLADSGTSPMRQSLDGVRGPDAPPMPVICRAKLSPFPSGLSRPPKWHGLRLVEMTRPAVQHATCGNLLPLSDAIERLGDSDLHGARVGNVHLPAVRSQANQATVDRTRPSHGPNT
jgi:hypothetical protein